MKVLKQGNKGLLLALFVALIFRSGTELMFPKFVSDYSLQIEAARNFMDGNGFTFGRANPDNLSEIRFSTLSAWPVGYPMLLVPFYALTGSSLGAQLGLQAFAALCFVVFFHLLLRYFRVPDKVHTLALLFVAITPTPFFYLGPSDLISAALFLGMTLFFLKSADNPGKLIWPVLIGFFAFLSAVTRYACIPNIVIFPLLFGLGFLFLRNKKWLFNAFLTFFLSGVLTLAFFFYFPIASSRTGFLNNLLELNLFWKHLLWFDPFPVHAVFFSRPIEYRLPDVALLLKGYRLTIFLFGALIFVAVSLQLFRKSGIKTFLPKINPGITRGGWLLLVLLMSTLVISSFLILQSLTTPPESNSFGPSWMPPFWTFVYSTRYFVIPMVLILFVFFVEWGFDKLGKWSRSLINFFFRLSMIWSLGDFFFINYQFFWGNGGGSEWNHKGEEIGHYRKLEALKSKDKDRIFVLLSPEYNEKSAPVMFHSAAYPCVFPDSALRAGLKCDDNTRLFLYLSKDSLVPFSPLLSTRDAKVVSAGNERILFSLNCGK